MLALGPVASFAAPGSGTSPGDHALTSKKVGATWNEARTTALLELDAACAIMRGTIVEAKFSYLPLWSGSKQRVQATVPAVCRVAPKK
jgi:hypothetical protein